MEETYYGYRFIALALIIGANAFFAASEVALISVRPSRLRHMAGEGRVGAQTPPPAPTAALMNGRAGPTGRILTE